jgi:hypothetical protein
VALLPRRLHKSIERFRDTVMEVVLCGFNPVA